MKITKRCLVLAGAAAGANAAIGSAVHAAPYGGGVVSFVTDGFAPSGIAPNGYGLSALGTLTVTNSGGVSGKYFPGYFNIHGGSTVGYIAVAGFLPADAPEIYALQVAINGVELLPSDTRLATLIADIKSDDDPYSIKNAGITTVLGSPFAPIFPGYEIVIPTSVAGGSDPYFCFDFGSPTDPDSALGAVSITSIAAIPEPASLGLMIPAAGGLLLSRRRRHILCPPSE